MTACVLFDLFGVIARPQSAEGLARIEAASSLAGPGFWDAYWRQRPPYDRGECFGHEYWHRVAEALGRHLADDHVAALIEADVLSWSAVDEEMVSLVGELSAQGVQVALLSNIPEDLAAHYEQRYRWLDAFSLLALSCRTGHAKPEAQAYHWCAEALGVPPSEVLFVDDRADNVAAAEATGMRGHLFSSPPALRSTLTAEGLLLPQSRPGHKAGQAGRTPGSRRHP